MKKLLQKIFGSELIEIHHIGSTSVKGLSAKPIIDIMIVVKNIHRIDNYNTNMIPIGYEPKGENGLKGRRYFQKGGDKRTHHVHIYEIDNPAIERHLAFRDYLREHPDAVKRYGTLKEELSRLFPYEIHSYISGKEQLVLELERMAIAWYRKENRF
ncbi:GrpB family protein [Peribacillus huizhouensis]|uniref:GrpB-like predicted nucleotidyltransferase (UPF0157 family) n=1 Tax=Peribacillus huizhouensis TaxID=1501239 RepID=A0ABR6CME2_9BACI|nr:GrpB family protein [Peribacillus huizhouensis]MBA9026096.1 GrpB-like predicted nucleotidyltransferase (UPF0157 family) [Peribacillus huizhouensis]